MIMVYKYVFGVLYLLTTGAFSDVNIAFMKPTKISSTRYTGCCDSDYAVDGDTRDWVKDGVWEFRCSHSDGVPNQQQEWLAVDLLDIYTIRHIDIYGRTDDRSWYLENFDVEVILPTCSCNPWDNLAVGSVFHCHYQATGVEHIVVTCPQNTTGRFVRIQRRDLKALVICELEIYGNLTNSSFETGIVSRTNVVYACGHIGFKYLGPVIETSVAQSNIHCTLMCVAKTTCTAAEYDKKANVCILKGGCTNGTQSSLLQDNNKNVFFIQHTI